MTDHSLTLGDLPLTDSIPDEDHDFTLSVLGDDATFGVAASVQEVVRSLLADGDIVRTTRHGNREVSFRVLIEGPSLGSVAHGEAALRAEVGRANLLTWQAPDVLSVPTVFEVVASEMAQTFDDLDELKRRRVFVLTLTCKPFARSVEPVTLDALASGTSTVVVDACDSTTGWAVASGSPDALSQSAGAVWATDSAAGNDQMSLRRSAAIDVSAHPYFKLEWKANPGPGYMILGLSAAADQFPSELRRVALGDGWFRSTWLVEPGDLDSGFQLSYVNTSPSESDYLGIREVVKSDIQPGQTPRQVSRIIVAGGTERTPASIRVAAPDGSTDLGLTILHTSPEDGSGYSPPLRRWRTLGNTVTTDATLLSGAREPLHASAVQFMVPTSALPEGAYELCARLRASASGAHRIFFTGFTQLPPPNDGSLLGPLENAETINFAAANEWVYASLGILTLPTVRTTAGMVVINVQRDASVGATIDYDEMWLFRIGEDCALTVEEIPSPNMWADSPGVGSSVPTLWMGSDYATRSNPGTPPKARGNHVLRPEGTAMFAATTGVENPEVSGTFYRLWHSNAAE